MKLTILVPTFNEANHLQELVHRLHTALPFEAEIVLVDDRSSDATPQIAQKLQREGGPLPVRLYRNSNHRGKGACLRTGLYHAVGELVVVQDADLEYDPRDLPALVQPLLRGEADAVYGSRFLRAAWPEGMRWQNLLANRLLTWLANRLYGLRLTDAYTCYKVVRRELLQRLQMESVGFEWEAEVTAKLGRARTRIMELPIRYRGRTRRQGKKIRAGDLWTGIAALLRWRLGPA